MFAEECDTRTALGLRLPFWDALLIKRFFVNGVHRSTFERKFGIDKLLPWQWFVAVVDDRFKST